MILLDTSVWVDYLRGAETPATHDVRRRLADSFDEIAICEPIAMELLAGAGTDHALDRLERLVNGLPSLAVEASTDFRDAAAIYRATRRAGSTVRSLTDCVIAAIVLRHAALLVHKDVDYETIGRVTDLQQISVR